jgi:hypothetical protein
MDFLPSGKRSIPLFYTIEIVSMSGYRTIADQIKG